jgi:hypothetical protein
MELRSVLSTEEQSAWEVVKGKRNNALMDAQTSWQERF